MGTNMQVNFTTKFMKKLKKGHAAQLWENINMLVTTMVFTSWWSLCNLAVKLNLIISLNIVKNLIWVRHNLHQVLIFFLNILPTLSPTTIKRHLEQGDVKPYIKGKQKIRLILRKSEMVWSHRKDNIFQDHIAQSFSGILQTKRRTCVVVLPATDVLYYCQPF